MWGSDYYETTIGIDCDKAVQRSVSPVGPEAHTGENDVIAPLVVMTSFGHPLFFSTKLKLTSKL